ncbi:MAG TPA: peptidylprolyl isomerase [Streptosporangiaceae bacterium]|nr:peptidylprolyl isomerase [Streptosporangiaceae bacterium]
MQQPRPLRPNDPREVDGYRLIGRLGEGAQGIVFLGESGTGVRVAVKVLRAEIDQDSRARTLFERELAAVRRVAPFCTAQILAAEADGHAPYIVSEYVDGPSLQQLVSQRGPLPAAEVLRLAIGTATALLAIHEAGVVHRDFKPANVLLGADGPKVIDFGIAKPLEAAAATMTAVVGTPAYMAPEQMAGTAGGPPLDMFAWGCTMAYAANGVPPFGGDSVPAVMSRILHEEPSLGALDGQVRELVAACLAKEPARRPTARDVLVRLLGLENGGDLLTEGTSAAATLTADTITDSATLPSALLYPPPPAAVPPAPGTPVELPSAGAADRRRRLLVGGAAAAAVVLVTGAAAAVIYWNGRGGGGNTPQEPSSPSAAAAAAGPCRYLPQSEGAVRNVGVPPSRPVATGRVQATVETNLGTLTMRLDGAKAPCTVNSIVYLADRKFYDNTPCHRLTTSETLKVLQCGDPSGTGTGGPAYRFGTENTAGARYTRGTVAIANAGTSDSNGSQFFILYADAPDLPPTYTVVGNVATGMDIVDRVAAAGAKPGLGEGDGPPNRRITITQLRTATG